LNFKLQIATLKFVAQITAYDVQVYSIRYSSNVTAHALTQGSPTRGPLPHFFKDPMERRYVQYVQGQFTKLFP